MFVAVIFTEVPELNDVIELPGNSLQAASAALDTYVRKLYGDTLCVPVIGTLMYRKKEEMG